MSNKNSLDTQNIGRLHTILISNYKQRAEPHGWHQLHCVPQTSADFTGCLPRSRQRLQRGSHRQCPANLMFILTLLLPICCVVNGLLNLWQNKTPVLDNICNAPRGHEECAVLESESLMGLFLQNRSANSWCLTHSPEPPARGQTAPARRHWHSPSIGRSTARRDRCQRSQWCGADGLRAGSRLFSFVLRIHAQ